MNDSKQERLKKREQLKAQMDRTRTTILEKDRKVDTRQKILLGALMLNWIEKGKLSKKEVLKELDGFLSRSVDRKLFGLPDKNEES